MKNTSNKKKLLPKTGSLILLFFICHLHSQAQFCFTDTVYSVGTTTEIIVSGDFNSDGNPDLLVTYNISNDPIRMFPGNGLGGFGAPVIALQQNGIYGMAIADFNGDGKLDLAMPRFSVGDIAVSFGNGSGGFSVADTFAAGTNPLAVITADFNGDGKIDIATANSGTQNISVLLGNGTGQFAGHVDYPVGNGPIALGSGDFNGDGKIDIAVANDFGGGPDSVFILINNGSGSFGQATKYLAGSCPYSVCSKDFNADGFDDVAVVNTNSDNVSVFMSQGASGTFVKTNYPTGLNGGPFSVVSADFDGDGKFDLATCNRGCCGSYYGNRIGVMLGAGNGSFGPPTVFTAWAGPWTIVTADFNLDGKPDLATANQSSNNITVLINCMGVGIESFQSGNKEIIVYPNPAADNLTVELPASISKSVPIAIGIKIFNPIGELEYSSKTTSQKTTVDVSTLANGLHIIQITSGSTISRQRFIKQ